MINQPLMPLLEVIARRSSCKKSKIPFILDVDATAGLIIQAMLTVC